MPQRGIGDFGSSSAAFAKERSASSWLKPKRRITPWSKYRWASGLEVWMGCRWEPSPVKSSGGFSAGAGAAACSAWGAWAIPIAGTSTAARTKRTRFMDASSVSFGILLTSSRPPKPATPEN